MEQDLASAASAWRRDGFVVLPGYLTADVLAPAVAELELMFPSARGFHDESDHRRKRYLGDEFAGVDGFPFASTQLSLLAVHDRITHLARVLLQGDDLRMYSAEAWAKYTGAADYDQDLHRDYLAQTVVVPSEAAEFRQLEMFVFLVDVPQDLGPPHLVAKTHTAGLEALPNWLPRRDRQETAADPGRADRADRFVAAAGHPELYEREVSAAGPAGTVVAYEQGTFHRGTRLTKPEGARFTIHVNFRRAAAEWGQRHAWADRSHQLAWYRFVAGATARQLELFGFPPPGHPYWTADTLAGVAQRYPGLDMSPWRARSPGTG